MKRIGITIIASLIFHFYSFGAYLSNVPITIIQPDGTKIDCFATGDEYYNWAHDKDGYTIIQNPKTGYYCYAILKGEDLVSSDYVVGKILPEHVNITPYINIATKKVIEKVNEFIQKTPPKEIIQKSAFQLNATTKPAGIVNNIIVYIRFADQVEFPANQGVYTSVFNSSTNGANSMRNYFKEVSYNQLDVVSHFYPSNNGTAILSYHDSHNRDYFCPYSITNPLGYTDLQRTEREHTLLYNAIDYVKNQIPASLNLDYNNDGYVDNICFIVRGGSTAWNTLLWPHKWSLFSRIISINGKRVYDFNFQLDDRLSLTLDNGVLCHEMNHTFGAPDLYHSNSDSSPVGYWDLMGSNRNPPQHMSSYMKYKYGGWISSIPLITTSGTYTLQPLTSPINNCYKIPIAGSSQYIIVEYRKKTGIFESSILGSGLIIYRINENYRGNFNGVGHGGASDEVYVFRRDGTILSNGYINDAYFSELSGRTCFSNTTNPHCFVSNGNLGDLYIKNVRENADGTLNFDVRFCDDDDLIYSNTSNLPPISNAVNHIQTQGIVVVKNADDIIFEARNEIILNPGFEVQLGGRFEININECGNK